MGKGKDLSDLGQTEMSRWLSQSISITSGFRWFQFIVVSTYQQWMSARITEGRTQAGRSSVMLRAMFCWKTLWSGFHVNVFFDTYHLPLECGRIRYPLSTRQSVLPHCKNCSGGLWERWQRVHGVDLASMFSRSKSYLVFVGCVRWTGLIYRCPTFHLTDLKGSTIKVLMPETKAHLQNSMWLWCHKWNLYNRLNVADM